MFKHEITEKTKKGYEQRIERLKRDGYTFNENVQQTKNFLSSYPVQTRLDLLNVILLIDREQGKDVEIWREYRDQLYTEVTKDRQKKLREKKLPTVPFFLQKLDELYETGQWYRYILNYLCFCYGVRNEDLDIDFFKSMGNYVIYDSNEKVCIYVRNNYKTVKTYGSKIHIIRNPKFIHAYQMCEPPKKHKQIGPFLKLKLLLPEGDMFKMHIKDLEEKGDTEKIRLLSESRGTNINTVLNYYNLNTDKYIIR
jgi:hypothetical protein